MKSGRNMSEKGNTTKTMHTWWHEEENTSFGDCASSNGLVVGFDLIKVSLQMTFPEIGLGSITLSWQTFMKDK